MNLFTRKVASLTQRFSVQPMKRRHFLKSFAQSLSAAFISQHVGSAFADDRTSPPPNVVLVVLDTLRADRLHCYGNPRKTSPVIDRLVTESTLFEKAFAQCPWTLPSHASFMTSKFPGRFIVGVNGVNRYLNGFHLNKGDITLASILSRSGYHTRSYNDGGMVGEWTGISEGFESYNSLLGNNSHGAKSGIKPFTASAEFFRDINKDKPFFLFLQSYECHQPYVREKTFGGKRPKGLGPIDFPTQTFGNDKYATHRKSGILGRWQPNTKQIEYFKTVYDGSVKFVDQALSTVIDSLKDQKLYDNTMIVVTSDHGEEFWEHYPIDSAEQGHSFFDEMLHVPLIIKFPNQKFAGKRFKEIVSLVDIVPTVLDTLKISADDLKPVGQSLVPYLQSEEQRSRLEQITYSSFPLHGPMRYSVRTDRYQYIYAPIPQAVFGIESALTDLPQHALYDLKADPNAQINIVAEDSKSKRRLEKEMGKFRKQEYPTNYILDDTDRGVINRRMMMTLGLGEYHPALKSSTNTLLKKNLPEMSQQQIEQLRALGYL